MEDSLIVGLYWQRSESAIQKTAEKYGPYCNSIANHILNSTTDAEECVNDMYLSAWNAMPKEKPAKLGAFVGRITRNIALNRVDYNTAQKRGGGIGTVLAEVEECLAAPDTESHYEMKETLDAINNFLRSLKYTERNAFIRRYWYMDSIKEVAERFGMKEGQTKTMLFRTRGKCRDFLKREGIQL